MSEQITMNDVYAAIRNIANMMAQWRAQQRFVEAYRLARLEHNGGQINIYSVDPHMLKAARQCCQNK